MGYRETFFNNTPSMMGKYQCCRCGKWFPKSNIDVDQRIPKRKGGTDDLYNLQAMCKHCNRSKGANNSNEEVAQTLITGGIQGIMTGGLQGGLDNVGNTLGSMGKQALKDALGIKYKRK